MSMLDMSLDEIIARRNAMKNNRGGANRFPRGGRNQFNYSQEYASNSSAFTRFENVPRGKWDHGGFEEMYGYKTNAAPPQMTIRGSARNFTRIDLAKKVCIHVTQLAPTVNSVDLNVLLAEFTIVSATVNYDEFGNSLGTADIIADRATAREIVANFQGIILDGCRMRFHVIDDKEAVPDAADNPVNDRFNFGTRQRRGMIRKRLAVKRDFKFIGNNRRKNRRPKRMTDEELDRELDEYMKKREQKKVKETEEKMES